MSVNSFGLAALCMVIVPLLVENVPAEPVVFAADVHALIELARPELLQVLNGELDLIAARGGPSDGRCRADLAGGGGESERRRHCRADSEKGTANEGGGGHGCSGQGSHQREKPGAPVHMPPPAGLVLRRGWGRATGFHHGELNGGNGLRYEVGGRLNVRRRMVEGFGHGLELGRSGLAIAASLEMLFEGPGVVRVRARRARATSGYSRAWFTSYGIETTLQESSSHSPHSVEHAGLDGAEGYPEPFGNLALR